MSAKKVKRKYYPSELWQWAVIVLAILGFGANYLWTNTGKPPAFYEDLKQISHEQQAENAKQFNEKLETINQQIRSTNSQDLQIVFTQDEINSWLAKSLPMRFPRALPKEVNELLVKLEPETSSLVINVDSQFFKGFATADFQLAVDDRPNLLVIELQKFYSGLLSVPIGKFRKRIIDGAANARLPLTWDNEDLPTKISVDLDQILSEQLIRPTQITDIEIRSKEIEIHYQFLRD